MLYRSLVIICALFVMLSTSVMAKNAVTLHVSPSGTEKASGTIDDPLNSIAAARNKVRQIKNKHKGKPINVVFAGVTTQSMNLFYFGKQMVDKR